MTDITFESLGLSKEILESIEKKGYKNPSSIQSGVIPLALKTTKDIIGQAQTGSGKTAAFGLPIIDKIDKKSNKLQSIILTPTRELAMQIAEELKSFGNGIKITLLYGGQNIRSEIAELKRSPQIVVGTPGRIIDHLNKKRLDLSNIKYFVLDEADEMLNVGFREEIEEILKFSPKEKRVFLFSATMPPFILNIVKNYMGDYEKISIKKQNLTNENITQICYESPNRQKFEVLCRILDVNPDFYGIIFCKTKVQTDELASKLSKKGYLAEAIHGDIEQSMREKVLFRFKSNFTSILVATDVAARGIDVNNLTHVINFDLPENPEIYTHRIGRTGRAGKNGTAITIIQRIDFRKFNYIKRTLRIDIKKEKLPSGQEIVDYKKAGLVNDIEKLIGEKDLDYVDIANELLSGKDADLLIGALLKKFYKEDFKTTSYKDLNLPKFSKDNNRRNDYRRRDDGMQRLFIAKGKLDGMENPGMLLSFIARESGLGDLGAGKVDILKNFSYIDFPHDIASIILKEFKQKNPSKPLVVKAKEKRGYGNKRPFNPRGFRNNNRNFKKPRY